MDSSYEVSNSISVIVDARLASRLETSYVSLCLRTHSIVVHGSIL